MVDFIDAPIGENVNGRNSGPTVEQLGEAIATAAENGFADTVHDLLIDISTDVNGVIASAQALIANARKRIDQLFEALPAELREWAAGEQGRFGGLLDGLTDRTEDARTAFIADVTERAVDAVADVQQKVEELRTKAKGVLGELGDAIAAFLEDPARAILNGLLAKECFQGDDTEGQRGSPW